MRCCFFYHTDLGQNFFLSLFKPIILQFFTVFQDKLPAYLISRTMEESPSFAQQIMALTTLRFHEENSIMLGLFN